MCDLAQRTQRNCYRGTSKRTTLAPPASGFAGPSSRQPALLITMFPGFLFGHLGWHVEHAHQDVAKIRPWRHLWLRVVHTRPDDVRHNLNSLSRVALVFQKHSSRGPRLRRTQGKLSWPHTVCVFQHRASPVQSWPCSTAFRYSSESLRITLRYFVRVP
jgi:hypothetical protein